MDSPSKQRAKQRDVLYRVVHHDRGLVLWPRRRFLKREWDAHAAQAAAQRDAKRRQQAQAGLYGSYTTAVPQPGEAPAYDGQLMPTFTLLRELDSLGQALEYARKHKAKVLTELNKPAEDRQVTADELMAWLQRTWAAECRSLQREGWQASQCVQAQSWL